MERESNQLEAGPILCRTGCGFFGSSNTDGLCSKCYKDALKKKQQPPNSGSNVTAAPSSCGSTSSASVSIGPASSAAIASPVAATAQPTIPALSQNNCSIKLDNDNANDTSTVSIGSSSTTLDTESANSPEEEGAKKKKNKCLTCKKKVGLTGFTCRCGGLYCSVHRYSNEHRCSFDYRELGAEEIRRNNPVVKGEKIQKI